MSYQSKCGSDYLVLEKELLLSAMAEFLFISFICRPTEILVMLHPYTAENEDGKYVCMQLVIKLDEKVN